MSVLNSPFLLFELIPAGIVTFVLYYFCVVLFGSSGAGLVTVLVIGVAVLYIFLFLLAIFGEIFLIPIFLFEIPLLIAAGVLYYLGIVYY